MKKLLARLGLPWSLCSYKPLNGSHPLVRTFIENNNNVTPVQIKDFLNDDCRRDVWLSYLDHFSIEQMAQDFDILFAHTTPTYSGGKPWIFHFESVPSLFMPFMFTGNTRGVDLKKQDWFNYVKKQLNSSNCLIIFSHMKSSLKILEKLFDEPKISKKLSHIPLSIKTRRNSEIALKFKIGTPLRILFTNSLHGNPKSFFLRGGHHLLEAFADIRKHLPNAELTIRSRIPENLSNYLSSPYPDGVKWIDSLINDEELDQLFLDHQIFALPAAGLHSHSLLRALAHGCVPILSDAFGYDEYVEKISDSVLQINGVRDLVYRKEPDGWVSDFYEPFTKKSQYFVNQIKKLLLSNSNLELLHKFALENIEYCRNEHSVNKSHSAFNNMLFSSI
jgi:hypothetical protein